MLRATSSEISWMQASITQPIRGTGSNLDLELLSHKSLTNAAKLTWMSNSWDDSKFQKLLTPWLNFSKKNGQLRILQYLVTTRNQITVFWGFMDNSPLELDHLSHNQAVERQRLRQKPLVIGSIRKKRCATSSKTKIAHHHEVQCLATIFGYTNKHWTSVTRTITLLFDLAAFTFLYACVTISFLPKLMSIARSFLDDIGNSLENCSWNFGPKLHPLEINLFWC